jgi:AbiV family abortive infection protein
MATAYGETRGAVVIIAGQLPAASEGSQYMAKGGTFRKLSASQLRLKARQCLEHASDVLQTAKQLVDEKPHIAYHLATLALEEIGKSGMLLSGAVATDFSEAEESLRIDKHEQNLLFALWAPAFGRGPLDRKYLEQCQVSAKGIHRNRLKGLYVDTDADDLRPPKNRITKEAASTLIKLADTRVRMEQSLKRKPANQAQQAEIRWFLQTVRNPEDFKRIFCKGSMERLAELASGKEWVSWLKRELAAAEDRKQHYIEAEANRQLTGDGGRLKPKWRVRIRLFTESHIVKAKQLACWPAAMDGINVIAVGKESNQLFVDFMLNESCPLSEVWQLGLVAGNHFLLAINIATYGFFWWHPVRCQGRYYEKIDDIENGVQPDPIPNRRFSIDWGKLDLDAGYLGRVNFALAMLPSPFEQEKHTPFSAYLTALWYIAKCDEQYSFVEQACNAFLLALKEGIKLYEGVTDCPCVRSRIGELIDGYMGNEEDKRLLRSVYRVENKGGILTVADLRHVKLVCDIYFCRTFERLYDERR